jgi:hypothetical protein
MATHNTIHARSKETLRDVAIPHDKIEDRTAAESTCVIVKKLSVKKLSVSKL